MVTRTLVIVILVLCAFTLGPTSVSGNPLAAPLEQDVKPFSGSIPYEGRLATADGQIAQEGQYSLHFELYDDLSAGQLLWSETVDNVPVVNGNFSTALGDRNPIPAELMAQKLWLAVSVRGPGEGEFTALEPRQSISVDGPVEAAASAALTCEHNHYLESWTGSNASYGFRIFNNGNGDGIRAYSSGTAANDGAVYAVNQATTGSGTGVYGYSSRGPGVSGESGNNDGVKGLGRATNKSGVWGTHTGNGYGVYGSSLNRFGVGASGGGDSSGYDAYGDLFLAGTRGEIFVTGPHFNTYSGMNFNIDLDNDNNDANACMQVWDGTEVIRGRMCENGTKSAILQTESHGQRAVYTIESPEVWLEDFGSAALNNGQATVNVDPMFKEMANLGVEYHVFLTPLGECSGLYVAAKNPDGFVVKELGGGTANVPFDYRITAKRLGLENLRAEVVGATADGELR